MNVYIALTGPTGAGKSEAASILANNFPRTLILSSSRFIREELVLRAEDVSAQRLREYGVAMMREHGPGYWTRKMLAHCEGIRSTVVLIDGLRNVGGITPIREANELLYVVGFNAPIEVRLRRVKLRARDIERELCDEAIWQLLNDELIHGPAWGMQIMSCLDYADFLIDGGQTIERVSEQLRPVIDQVKKVGKF